MNAYRRLITLVATIGVVIGCKHNISEPSTQVFSVTVALDREIIGIGQTTQATATLRDADGNQLASQSITWSADPPYVATVSTSGLLTGITQGTAVIRAVSGDKQGLRALTVEAVDAVIVSPPAGTMIQQTFAEFPNARVAFSGYGLSSKSGSTGISLAWTLDGVTVSSPALVPLGVHTLCLLVTSPAGNSSRPSCVAFQVVPGLLTIKSIAIDPSGNEYVPIGQWVVLGPDNGTRDSARVGSDGNAIVNTRYVGATNVPVDLRGDANLIPSRVRTSPEFFQTPRVIIIPKLVNAPSCAPSTLGRAVSIDLEKAYAPAQGPVQLDPTGFFQRWSEGVATDIAWRYDVGSWRDWPIKLAFYPTSDDSVFTPSDSIAFWAAADSLNSALCTPVITPANRNEVEATSGIHALRTGGTAWAQLYSSIDYTSAAIGVNPRVAALWYQVSHETIHTLGFGHTSSWPSVMPVYCGFLPSCSVHPEDVAHILLMRWVRALERKHQTRFSLAWAHQGERLSKGLPEEAVRYVGTDGRLGTISSPRNPIIPPPVGQPSPPIPEELDFELPGSLTSDSLSCAVISCTGARMHVSSASSTPYSATRTRDEHPIW